jgi:hypothetical protein
VFTGLLKGSNQTSQTILESFWMNPEFVVFFTLDEKNQVSIETFSYSEEIQEITVPIPLCELTSVESIEIKADPKRQLISFFMFNTVSA